MRYRECGVLKTILLIGLQLSAVTLHVNCDTATSPQSTDPPKTTSQLDDSKLPLESTKPPAEDGKGRADIPEGGEERAELPTLKPDEAPNKLGIAEQTVSSSGSSEKEGKAEKDDNTSGEERSSDLSEADGGDSRGVQGNGGGFDVGSLAAMGQQALPVLQRMISLIQTNGKGVNGGKKKTTEKPRKDEEDEDEDEKGRDEGKEDDDDDDSRSGLEAEKLESRAADVDAAESRTADLDAEAESRAADAELEADPKAADGGDASAESRATEVDAEADSDGATAESRADEAEISGNSQAGYDSRKSKSDIKPSNDGKAGGKKAEDGDDDDDDKKKKKKKKKKKEEKGKEKEKDSDDEEEDSDSDSGSDDDWLPF